jgi:hypothetical protein
VSDRLRRWGRPQPKRSGPDLRARRISFAPSFLSYITAALFVLPTSAFLQVGVEIGPGGVYVGPRYHRDYDDGYHRGDRYGGGRCGELRQACLRKEELGEQERGNCRRYREICR